MLKALFFLKIFLFLPWLFDHVVKQRDKKDKIKFKIYNITDRKKNNCKAHIAQ